METEITDQEQGRILKDIQELGYSVEQSKSMLDTFLKEGGLSCL